MWWFDCALRRAPGRSLRRCRQGVRGRRQGAHQAAHAALLAGICAMLAGCTMQPLYGDRQIVAQLAQVEVEPVRSLGDNHAGIVAWRHLSATLNPGRQTGNNGGAPRYRLAIVLDTRMRTIGIEQGGDIPAARSIDLDASFTLNRIGDNAALLEGRAKAAASHDFFGQRYANIRAGRDATERAARLIARDITTQIAAFFALQGAARDDHGHPAPR